MYLELVDKKSLDLLLQGIDSDSAIPVKFVMPAELIIKGSLI